MIRKQLFLWFLLPVQLLAQEPVSLSDCREWAREQHPFLKQQELYRQMTELKLANNETGYLPQIGLNAQATYQSDVTRVGISLPGVSIPEVSKDQYKMYLDVRQHIWDGGLTKANERLETAQEATNLQGVEVELYQVNEQVNYLFFTSFVLQQNLEVLAKKKETLEAGKRQAESGVKHGMVLASDLDLLLAELIKVKQQQIELQSNRETVHSALAILTGKQPADLQNLAIEPAEPVFDRPVSRPELNLFDKQTDLLDAASDLLQKKRNPRLFGFGQAGYGRPGLNMLNDAFDTYYLVGLGLNWTVFDWKNTKRDKEMIRLQQQIVQTQQQQFERQVNIALDSESRKIRQLKDILESDRELIELQERITKSSASKLENGAITMSDYLQDLNAEAAARITFETHKVQLEAAKINYQNIQGN
ncbi:TolC family protein [Gaoshiqia sp. Z1-71]|uniref:TolC family protein n=1 Tax=Gaoshiqia hydrogeniformans TaxID=3290090 RepID=UPI003BF7BE6C